jgi:tetratricopeptide (TPR) repeat protein
VEEARRELEGLLMSNPASPQALAMLSQLLVPRGRASELLPFAERAVAEGGLENPVIMQVWIRTLDAAGLADSALSVSARWTRREPGDVTAHSERARLLAALGRTEEAVTTLQEARESAGDSAILAQELADLFAARGEYGAAAHEWAIMLGWGDIGVSAVAERLRRPEIDASESVESLEEVLSTSELPAHVRRNGLALALELDDRSWARSMAEQLTSEVPSETRRLVLRDYYLACRNRDWSEDAAWAAGRLVEESADEAERKHWRAMEADVALDAGQTAEAELTFAELAISAASGTETHRRSVRRLFSLKVASGSTEAPGLLRQYAKEYPEEGDEIVEMAIELSNARVAARDLTGALDALQLVADSPTPKQASRLAGQRGVITLLAGRPGSAIAELETAIFIPAGDPIRRTDALFLLQVLERADSSASARLGGGMLDLLADGDPGSLLDATEDWSQPDRSDGSGPALMSVAAGALDREGFVAEAAEVRLALVGAYPGAYEAASAMLELGRHARLNDGDQAREWFERLVVSFPDHALAPLARQELAEMAASG